MYFIVIIYTCKTSSIYASKKKKNKGVANKFKFKKGGRHSKKVEKHWYISL